jgi:hypothetical protein
MTTLCIDELAARLKRRWGWEASATHVPLEADCPLLASPWANGTGGTAAAVVPAWLRPTRGVRRPPGIPGLHGKTSPSVG